MLKIRKNESQIATVETLCEGLEMCLADFDAEVDRVFQARAEAEPKNAEQLELDRIAEKKFYRSRIESLINRFRGYCEDDRIAIAPKAEKASQISGQEGKAQ